MATHKVLNAVAPAEAKLGELKGFVHTVPNEAILLNTLPLQESRASSEIENIVTTDDELFRARVENKLINQPIKEVQAHADALLNGFNRVRAHKTLRSTDLLEIHQCLIGNDAGMRTQMGTVLKNDAGEIIYTPPAPSEVPALMDNLIKFINDADFSPLNPLIKMAVIHYQFESIHPFYDGNGRTGRILNLLYLVLCGRLDLPVLYLSRYIIATKSEYYRLLQAVREEEDWDAWLIYLLKGIATTATQAINLLKNINNLLHDFKHKIRENHSRHYSQDLINVLFKHPYTRIEFVQRDLNCSYRTASYKLKLLTESGFMREIRRGRSNYYMNDALVECLMNVHDEKPA